MFTQAQLDRELAVGSMEMLGDVPRATPAEPDDDPFAVPGLEVPAFWRGDEEASMSGLMVDVRST